MRRTTCLGALVLMLAACSPPRRFALSVVEPDGGGDEGTTAGRVDDAGAGSDEGLVEGAFRSAAATCTTPGASASTNSVPPPTSV